MKSRISYIFLDRFYDKRDAEDALDAMDGRLLDGRELRVQMARYGRPTSPHRSRGSRRRGRWVFLVFRLLSEDTNLVEREKVRENIDY